MAYIQLQLLTFNFLIYITFVLILVQVQAKQKRYQNLYNQTFHSLENVIQTISSVRDFVRDSNNYQKAELPDMTPEPSSMYDFIVVGAGTAGATIAARLVEISEARVLLIEAGRNENLLIDIPTITQFFAIFNEIDWKYYTEPSYKYCLGNNNKQCFWPQGKIMGGSSVLNYMIATRGSPEDYDRWAEFGNDGWSYEEVKPYFKKLENMKISELAEDKEYHNTDGPVHITYPRYRTPLAENFLKAGVELGYPLVDYNGKENIGFSYLQTTISNGTRMSSNRAYLHRLADNRQLHVSKMSMVNRIVIDPKSKRAKGVEFTKNRVKMTVYARKEVILCAGTIGSAQLLMLSGVGPEKHLRSMGIDIIKNAPVGDNLMDHIAYGGLTFLVDQPIGLYIWELLDIVNPYWKDFIRHRKGPFTIPGGCEALAFIDVDNPNKRLAMPNVELLFCSTALGIDFAISNIFNMRHDVWEQLHSNNNNKYAWTVFPMLLKPKSRGYIRLKSKNVNVKPKIVPNYLDDPEDVKILIQGIRAAINISKTNAMQEFGSRLVRNALPGCENHLYGSDSYWECAIRTITFNIFHYSGTCKMGPESDPTAVVNPRLQVIGVSGLRVADASIMPEIPSGHTNIPVYMIAEKLADMVKEDWGYLKN